MFEAKKQLNVDVYDAITYLAKSESACQMA